MVMAGDVLCTTAQNVMSLSFSLMAVTVVFALAVARDTRTSGLIV